MAKRWILVAESSRARVFEQDNSAATPRELNGFTHAESRLHEGDLTSDSAGYQLDRMGQGQHAMEPPTNAKTVEAQVFAKELSEHIEAARMNGHFDELILIASPDFLGHLRKTINGATSKLISETIGKNLVQQSPEEIHSYLPGHFLSNQ